MLVAGETLHATIELRDRFGNLRLEKPTRFFGGRSAFDGAPGGGGLPGMETGGVKLLLRRADGGRLGNGGGAPLDEILRGSSRVRGSSLVGLGLEKEALLTKRSDGRYCAAVREEEAGALSACLVIDGRMVTPLPRPIRIVAGVPVRAIIQSWATSCAPNHPATYAGGEARVGGLTRRAPALLLGQKERLALRVMDAYGNFVTGLAQRLFIRAADHVRAEGARHVGTHSTGHATGNALTLSREPPQICERKGEEEYCLTLLPAHVGSHLIALDLMPLKAKPRSEMSSEMSVPQGESEMSVPQGESDDPRVVIRSCVQECFVARKIDTLCVQEILVFESRGEQPGQ